jgi:GNAT superfamily N-acetyltransferase
MDMTAGIVIRRAEEHELDEVAALIVQAYGEYAAKMSPDAWSSFAVDIANVRGRASDAETLVAERDGRLVGTITQYGDWRGAQAGTTAVRLLAVPPPDQGSGVGRALMEHCMEAARTSGKERIALTAMDEMESVRELASKLGFEREPTLDHEPAPGVRARGWAYRFDQEP